MVNHDEQFWLDGSDELQELAKQFEQGIEITHPKHLSGRSERGINFCNCSWCAQRVKYYEYNGPKI